MQITDFIESEAKYPAELAGIKKGEIVIGIDGHPIRSLNNFSDYLAGFRPGDSVEITTDKSTYDIRLAPNPQNESMAYLGVYVQQETGITASFEERLGTIIPQIILWVVGLFRWLVILNLGIGLFNLVPMGPLDGGRMLQLVTTKYFGRKKGHKVWKYISLLFLALILINILYAFVS